MTVRRSRLLTLLVTAALAVVFGFAVGTSFSDDQSPSDWSAPPDAQRTPNPIPATLESIAAGKVVYSQSCLPCHGAAGKGDGPASFILNPKPRDLSNPKIAAQSDGSIFWKLSQGKKPMPSFADVLSEGQRWQVINYVRSLQPKPDSSQPASQPSQ